MPRSRHLIEVAVFATVLLLAFDAAAQSWPPLVHPSSVEKSGEDDVALLVAIEDYTYLPNVEGAAANAAEWERFLRRDLGIRKVLVLADEAATREEILTMADRAAAETNGDGRLWFVFIGHGAPSVADGEPVVVGVDGQRTPRSIVDRGVSQPDLLKRLQAGNQTHTIALFDACFTGRDADGEELLEGVQPVLPTVSPTPGAQTTIMTATRGDQVAGRLPDTSRPAFSYLVLGGLRGWADDGDGVVTAAEAVEFARVELLGVPGREQTPQVFGDSAVKLATGAVEPRPEVFATSVATTGMVVQPQPRTAAPTEPEPQTDATVNSNDDPVVAGGSDPNKQFDYPIFLRLATGTSGLPRSPADGITAEIVAGWKFDGPGAFEWRTSIGARYAGYHRWREGESVEVRTQSGDFIVQRELTANDDPVSQSTDGLILSLGPGFAWRNSSADSQFDHVVSAEVFGTIGQYLNFCPQSEMIYADGQYNSQEVECYTNDPVDPGVGGRIGYTWKFFDVGFNVLYAFGTNDIILTSTVGVALDP